jgi:hypothetical protein
MPVNSGGDKSGKASSGGPFGFLNKPSKQVAAKKKAASDQRNVTNATKVLRKPAPKHGSLSDSLASVQKSINSVAPAQSRPHPPRMVDPILSKPDKKGVQHYAKGTGNLVESRTTTNARRVASGNLSTGERALALQQLQRDHRLPDNASLAKLAHPPKVKVSKKKSGSGLNLGSIIGGPTAAAADLVPAAINAVSGSHIPLPSHLLHIAAAAGENVVRATAEDPSGVMGSTGREAANTLRGVGAAGLGALRATGGAAASLVAHPSRDLGSGGRGKAIVGGTKKFAKGTEADYVRRYGDVLSDPKAFRDRVKHEGALSYALDAAAPLGMAGKVGGEIAGAVARTGKLGDVAKAATEARPVLRIGGNEVRAQARSSNLFRALAQDAKDASRRKAVVKRSVDGRTKGLLPGDGEVVRRSVRAQNRDMRRTVSRISTRAGERTKRDQGREVHGGPDSSAAATKKLTKYEQLGLKYAIQLGIRDPATAAKVLAKHRAEIIKAREAGNFHADFNEIPVLDEILKHPESVFTPHLAEVAKGEVARAKRTAAIDPNLTADGAAARAHADQAAHLGIERGGTPIRVARKEAAVKLGAAKKALDAEVLGGGRTAITKAMGDVKAAQKHAAELKARKAKGEHTINPEPVASHVARVRVAAAHAKLDEPGYFPGRVFDEGNNAPYTGHNVGRAMAKDKRYKGTSFTLGVQDGSPQALQLALAKNIKRAHNYQGVADTLERSTPEWGRNVTAAEAKQLIRDKGLDPGSWSLVNAGLMRKAIEASDVTGDVAGTDARLAHAISKNIHTLDATPAEYGGSGARFHIVPKAVADELQAGMTPSGKGLRILAKGQGIQSKLLLNTNPTFVPVQVVSNTPLALMAMKGNVLDLFKAQSWYKHLDQEARDVVDEFTGVSASAAFGATARFGDSAGGLAKMWDATLNSQKYREWQTSIRNPMQWNPLLDGKQNAFFRRAVFYNEAKRQAAKGMGHAAGDILDHAQPLMDALKMPAGPERLAALRKAEPQAELIGERVNEMLGDFGRYTAKERQLLKTTVMFYGFMRWATRLALYTLPIKHPIATAMVGKLGQLHNEEVVQLLSGYGADHGVASKPQLEKLLREGAMNYAFGRVWMMKNGKLEYADATRLNPLMGPVIDAFERSSELGVAGPAAAGLGLASPAVGAMVDVITGKSQFTHKDLQDSDGNPLAGRKTAEYWAGQQARTIYPIRVLDGLLNPSPQSDESIPLVHPVKIRKVSASKAASIAAKKKARGSNQEYLLDQLLPIARTKGDNTVGGLAAIVGNANKVESRKGKKVTVKRKPGDLPTLPTLPALPSLPTLPKLP